MSRIDINMNSGNNTLEPPKKRGRQAVYGKRHCFILRLDPDEFELLRLAAIKAKRTINSFVTVAAIPAATAELTRG